MEVLEKITKAISFAYKADGTCPGLTISWLSHSNEYYVSIVRWIRGEKIIVCSTKDKILTTALIALSHKFILENPAPVNPIDELVSFISEKEKSELQSYTKVGLLASTSDPSFTIFSTEPMYIKNK